ncbi:MAG: YfjI family protein [Accumulibacter sp.]|jgi:hypothetical protein
MNAPYPIPQPDPATILSALAALFQPDDVVELRSFAKGGRKRTDAGYFDGEHRQALAEHAVRLNKTGGAVYVTLNPIDPQLLSRYANRVEHGAQATTTDAQVTRRRWLLLDFDPARPTDTSATDAQLEHAKAAARVCWQALRAEGWPDPLVAASGNGTHLLYALDLPNDTESRDLVKGALAGLAACFDTDQVKLDQSVFNAGRIIKLYGTVATKGDHTPLAPWRLSQLVATPERRATVTVDQLRAWMPATTAKRPVQAASYQPGNRQVGAFDLGDFLSRLGIASEQDTHEGSERFKLAHCPFNPEHGKGEAAIFRKASGALGFKCQHNSCSGKEWVDLRALVDGPREQRQGPAVDFSVVLKQEQGTASNNATDGAPASPSWPDPQPLAAKVEPEPYPLDALPLPIRAAVEEVVGFVKAPVPMVVSSALAALSLAAQAHMDVSRDAILSGPTGLFILTIADSGERKSQSDKMFTAPIFAYQDAQAEIAKPVIKDYLAAFSAWEAEREGILSSIRAAAKAGKPVDKLRADLTELERDKPEPPRVPKLIREDATPEGLAKKLQKEWPSAGVVSNEAGIVFGAHGMNRESVMRNLALLNKLWDGGRYQSDRGDEERSRDVRGARLTMGLMIQEPTLRAFFDASKGLARGTGFLARFLPAWPGSTMGTRFYTPPVPGNPALAEFHRRITALLNLPVPIDDDGLLSPPVLPMNPEAKEAWIEFHDAIEKELASGGEYYEVKDVASKTADNAVRLAALFQLFEHGMGSAVGLEAFESASLIAAWHLHEARRFFGEIALPAELADASRLDTWLIEFCQRERTHFAKKNHVRQHGPIRDGVRLDAAIRELAELDRLRLRPDGRKKIIQVNPALMGVSP